MAKEEHAKGNEYGATMCLFIATNVLRMANERLAQRIRNVKKTRRARVPKAFRK